MADKIIKIVDPQDHTVTQYPVTLGEAVKTRNGGNLEDVVGAKQNVTEPTLQTTQKTIPGAINELDSEVGNLETVVVDHDSRITGNTTAINTEKTRAQGVENTKQNITDSSLQTTSKTIPGAINELKGDLGETINHGTTQPSDPLSENDTHVWGVMTTLNLTNLSNPGGSYLFIFQTSDSTPVITLPEIPWNIEPEFTTGKTYYLGIIMGHGFFAEFDEV